MGGVVVGFIYQACLAGDLGGSAQLCTSQVNADRHGPLGFPLQGVGCLVQATDCTIFFDILPMWELLAAGAFA